MRGREQSGEAGQAIPLVALMMVVLLGCAGIAIDVGFGLLQKRRLQAAVDIALISGAKELPNANAAGQEAEDYVHENFSRVSDQEVSVEYDTSCMVDGCSEDDKLELSATTETPTFFARIFGIDNWSVAASGAACGPCDSSPVSYDVVVVLDRSYSMCLDSRNRDNGCEDLDNAKAGIRNLLTFFDPDTDRVSLAVLSSSDTNACNSGSNCRSSSTYGKPYSHTTAGPSYTWKTSSSSPAPCDSADPGDTRVSHKGRYYRSAGDFHDGTSSNHDKWVLVSLADGNDFKNEDGTLDENSELVETLDCIEHKYWTPIAPAVYEATEELRTNGRTVDDDGNEVYQAIVFFGDGGANAQPVRRQDNGDPTSTLSWYTPTSGNDDKPCWDAIGQANRARIYGIHVFTIGYALGEGSAADCTDNDGNTDHTIDAEYTMEHMADDDSYFYEQAEAGSVDDIFQAIGHAITAGGVRLVE